MYIYCVLHKKYNLVISTFMYTIGFHAFQIFFVLFIVIAFILSVVLVRETYIYHVYIINMYIYLILILI